MDDFTKGFIDGTMLGDGCLVRKTPTSNTYLNIKRVDKDYIYWQYEKIKSYCTDSGPRIGFHTAPGSDKIFQHYIFNTRCVEEFNIIHDKWYDNNIKHVPHDFSENNLTDVCLAVWFMDDGTYVNIKGVPIIRLYANCFSVPDLKRLQYFLYRRFGTYFSIGSEKRSGTSFLVGNGRAAASFYKRIGNIVKEALPRKYLWNDEIIKKAELGRDSNTLIQSSFEIKLLNMLFLCCDGVSLLDLKKISTNEKSFHSRVLKILQEKSIIGRKFKKKIGYIYKFTNAGKDFFKKNIQNRDDKFLFFNYKPFSHRKPGPK